MESVSNGTKENGSIEMGRPYTVCNCNGNSYKVYAQILAHSKDIYFEYYDENTKCPLPNLIPYMGGYLLYSERSYNCIDTNKMRKLLSRNCIVPVVCMHVCYIGAE